MLVFFFSVRKLALSVNMRALSEIIALLVCSFSFKVIDKRGKRKMKQET
jgi:hypothetical protein